MKKSVKFIYFDVGGVLLDWQQGQRIAAEKYHVDVSSIHAIDEVYWEHAGRGGDTTEYMKALAALFHLPEPFPESTDFWTNHHVPILETHALVIELKRFYKLGLLTNAEHNGMHNARRKGLLPDVEWDAIVDSSLLGVIKPEKRIYEIAEQMSGVKPNEIFFTDDRLLNVTTAKSRGWQGMVFETNNASRSVKKLTRLLLENKR